MGDVWCVEGFAARGFHGVGIQVLSPFRVLQELEPRRVRGRGISRGQARESSANVMNGDAGYATSAECGLFEQRQLAGVLIRWPGTRGGMR